MFEEYIIDADYFFSKALSSRKNNELAKRYFRAGIFSSFGAIEAYINFIANSFVNAKVLKPYEVALLTDKRFEFNGKIFEVTERTEFKKLEDKLKFIISKFIPDFDFKHKKCWSSFKDYKKLRDELTHPKKEEDEHTFNDYEKKIKIGFSSIINLMNEISKGVFKKPLRKKIIELIPQ